MRIFVTGGAGFIGSNFIRYLLRASDRFRVLNYDKLTYAGNLANLSDVIASPRYEFVRGDIRNGALLHECIEGCDAIVNFAAESHVDRSIYEPGGVIDSNIRGTAILLGVARERKVPRFIHISTDEVYGNIAPGQVADEQSPLCPNSPYSASKASSDLLIRSFFKTYGFPAIITRSSNNYGPRQFPEKFLPLIIANASEGKPIPIYGDGLQERDWVHVEDHCRAIREVLLKGREGHVYNIGSGGVEKNLQMAQRVLRILGAPESLIRNVADRPGHDRRYALDCSRIRNELGWHPRIELDEGLNSTVEWYLQNADWLSAVRDGEYRHFYEKWYDHREGSLKRLLSQAADQQL